MQNRDNGMTPEPDDYVTYYNEALISLEALCRKARDGGSPEILKAASVILLALACVGGSEELAAARRELT